MTSFSAEPEGKIQELLKTVLQKEIALMREILANLHEEELSLLASDKQSWAQTMQSRSDLIIEIRSLRTERHHLMCHVEQHARKKLSLDTGLLTLDQIFPVEEGLSCEIRSLLDQIFALIDRLNLQNARNDHLFDQTKTLNKAPMYCNYPHPHLQARTARRKTTTATQPP